ncbi:hypothetical protein KKF91_18230 [Myxococcota bacterium]|nr:hypothetical protein [Myxococcota bacterium]MBU1432481.1 hypothetical protein [Myxococcota bacterium]MBU1900735.1 hypothetical protein [Myxococcota bacterium]
MIKLLLWIALTPFFLEEAPVAEPYPSAPPARDEAALRAAVRAYYTATDPAGLRAAVADALAAGPETALYHEIAADLADLEDRPRATLRHLSAALLDPSGDNALLDLHRIAEQAWTEAERRRLEILLARLAHGHPRPEVRAYAAWMRTHALHLRGAEAQRDASLAEIGYRPPLAIIGTWDNDQGKGFDAVYPPEREINPAKGYLGKLIEIHWRARYPMDPRGKINLSNLMEPNAWQVAYAAVNLEVKVEGDYELRLGASNPTKVWLDEQLVFSGRRLSSWLFDGVVIPVHLKPGVHPILIKSAQQQGGWLMSFRVSAPGGGPPPPEALAHAPLDAQPRFEAITRPTLQEDDLLEARVRDLPPGPRRLFLKSVWAETLGLKAPTVTLTEAFLKAHPNALRGRYRLAMRLWDNGERGRTADLLQGLIQDFGDELLRVPLRQARFWTQQKLEVKARALLLRLFQEHPKHPGAYLSLASLFSSEGWHEEACAVLEAADDRWPRWPWVLNALADCRQQLSFFPEVEQMRRARLEALPYDYDALKALHWLLRGNDAYEEAVIIARRMTHAWPHERQAHLDLAETLRRARRPLEAEAALEAAIALTPAAAQPRQALAHLALQRDDKIAAIRHFRDALARDPENDEIAQRLAFLAPEEEGPWSVDVPGEAALEAAVAARATVTPKHGADVIYLLDDEVTSLASDGTTINIVTMVAHALNQAGRDQLTQMKVRSGGRSRILAAYAVAPDGRRVEASSIRGRTVRFRQLEVGSTVVFQYRIDQRPDGYLASHMARQWWFQSPGVQTHEGRWVLWSPKGTTVHAEVLGAVTHARREGALMDRDEWSARDTDPLVSEPGMPTYNEVVSHVIVSTVPDWDLFWKWERALLRDSFRESPELKALAAELFADKPSALARVEAIQAYLMSEIRYQQDYEHHIAGVKPHAAGVVLARQYGDCKDKAVLFITLARLGGVEAHFVLVRTRDAGPVRQAVPMQQFNHAIVYVPQQPGIEEARFYDPTVDALDIKVLRDDDQGTLAAVFDPNTETHHWRPIPFDPPQRDITEVRADLRLSAGGDVSGALRIIAQGRAGAALRKAARNPAQLRQILEQQAGRTFPGLEMGDVAPLAVSDVYRPAEVKLDLHAALARREGDALRFKLPFGWRPDSLFTLERRLYPVLMGTPRVMRWRLEVPLEGRLMQRSPAPIDLEADCIGLHRAVSVEGDRLIATQEVEMRCERIEVADYAAHRAWARRVRAHLDEEVVLLAPTAQQHQGAEEGQEPPDGLGAAGAAGEATAP